jgi:hypothetical protein
VVLNDNIREPTKLSSTFHILWIALLNGFSVMPGVTIWPFNNRADRLGWRHELWAKRPPKDQNFTSARHVPFGANNMNFFKRSDFQTFFFLLPFCDFFTLTGGITPLSGFSNALHGHKMRVYFLIASSILVIWAVTNRAQCCLTSVINEYRGMCSLYLFQSKTNIS